MSIRLPNPEGGVTIGGFDCNRRAFSITDLTNLVYLFPADEGDNLVTPDVEGEQGRYLMPRAQECVVPWAIVGNYDLDGNAVDGTAPGFAEWWDQALVNWIEVKAALSSFGIGTDPPVKDAVFTSAGGSLQLGGEVQVRGMQKNRTLLGHSSDDLSVVATGTMRIRVLAGELKVLGS